MPAQLSFTLLDHGEETTTVTIPTRTVSAANYDEVFGNIATQGRFELQSAIEGATLGPVVQVSGKSLDVAIAAAPPASDWAQRETALRVWGRGATSQKLYSISIGTADLVALDPGAQDIVSLANPAMAALVVALEDYWEPNYDGAVGNVENVTIVKAQVIGRKG